MTIVLWLFGIVYSALVAMVIISDLCYAVEALHRNPNNRRWKEYYEKLSLQQRQYVCESLTIYGPFSFSTKCVVALRIAPGFLKWRLVPFVLLSATTPALVIFSAGLSIVEGLYDKLHDLILGV